MPSIAVLLKDEILRICRREIRRQVLPVRKASATHRSEIAALKRQVAMLERKAKGLAKGVAQRLEQPSASDGLQVRFVAKGLRSLRTRLGLSAPQLAKLIGVSTQSVYNWETKKAAPRKEQLSKLVELRSMGKRGVQARLEAAKPKRKTSRRTRRKRRT